MKTPILFTLLLALTIVFTFNKGAAAQRKPLCVAQGTQYEGWLFPGENTIHSAACTDKIMECAAIGTRSEGWYVFEKQNIQLLQYSPCRYELASPTCMFIGTPNEAWVVPARGLRIYYEKCADKGVECTGENFETEGWYVYNKRLLGLYAYNHCSKEVNK
jgi:hypothetical protein